MTNWNKTRRGKWRAGEARTSREATPFPNSHHQTAGFSHPWKPRSAGLGAKRTRSEGTKPERHVRRALLRLGIRGFETNAKDLPGSPDIVIRRNKQAIFVHGCFWHLHPKCAALKLRGIHSDSWREKLARNVLRDRRVALALEAMGWRVLVVWECDCWDSLALQAKVGQLLVVQ